MAKNKISEFSEIPANNTDIAGIDIAEGCAPSGINNAIRTLMSDLKDWQTGATSTSNSDALAVAGGGTGAIVAADARTNLGAAKSGENTDITSLGGLTTPITVAQGGTGFVAQRTITAVGRASNVVTIATSAAHGYVVNDIVTVAAVTNTSVNGTFTISSVPTTTTFTYAQTGTNYANTTDTGTTTSASYLVAENISGTVAVNHGGTGSSSLKVNNLALGNGTSPILGIPAGKTGNVLTSTLLSTVTAGSFVVGTEYTIATVGTTNFMPIGAASNTVGVVFTATGAGTGTGTATTNTWTSSALDFQQSLSTTVTAGSFIVGLQYTILSVGTTNFIAIGAASNTVGVTFTATGVGSGTGTATTPSSGYQKLPSGLIIQWFSTSENATQGAFTENYPIAFPNAFLAASCSTTNRGSSSNADLYIQFVSSTTTAITLYRQAVNNFASIGAMVIAIGY